MGYFDDFELLNVTQVRMYGKGSSNVIRTHCHYLGIMQGEVIIDGSVEKRPFVYFTPSGIDVVSGWNSPEGRCRDNFYIECRGTRADRIFDAFGALHCPQRKFIADAAQLISIFNNVKELFLSGDPRHNSSITIYLEEFVNSLEKQLSSSKRDAEDRFGINRLISEINKEPWKNRDFAEYAAMSGVSLRHWNRVFILCAGMPPHRFVMHCRIHLAIKLLTSGNLSVKQISEMCGFDNPSDFSRFFRKHTGQSPGECRNNRMI